MLRKISPPPLTGLRYFRERTAQDTSTGIFAAHRHLVKKLAACIVV